MIDPPASELLPASVRSVIAKTEPGAAFVDAFARDVQNLTFRRLRIAGLLYAGVHVVSSLLVAIMSTEALAQWLAPRAAIVAVSITFSLLTYAPKLERHAFWLSIALALVTAVYILVPLLRFGLGWGSDHGSLVLLIVCTGLLFPYTMKQMLALTVSILVLYLGAALAVFRAGDSGWLLEGLFYVTSASAIVVVGARLAYKLRAGEFLARQELGRERDNAEQLLLNILPASIVARLKKDQTAIAEGFRDATVMFADLVGFTPLSAQMSPKALVEMLNEVFSRFDALTEKYGLEKIKTIGDAYMVAGGLPTPRSDHAILVANMALEMREVVENLETPTGDRLQVRIGINTGPVAAGVIGTKKFTYDLWGDTVNTAARMETHADPGDIQVTERSYERLKRQFHLEPRGTIEVKGKGGMRTYLLVGKHRPLA
ncbi:MAG: adenylate/guanylate cyclase domain-containing protein [Myxococcales bacterium]|nr:adenylate/guanylate cyclase domain-containing protein [Myxococcales bacterium]